MTATPRTLNDYMDNYAAQYLESEGFMPTLTDHRGKYTLRCYAIDPECPPPTRPTPEQALPRRTYEYAVMMNDNAGLRIPITDHMPRLLNGMLNQIRKDRAIGFTDRYHGRPDLTLRLMQENHRGTLIAAHHDSHHAEQDASQSR